jgi:5-methylthioadenosine/S-adenosylhomocysteine deaminase
VTAPRPVDLLVSGGIVVTMDPARRVLQPGAVAIEGNRVAAVGPVGEIEAAYAPARRIDATGRMVLPGFVNLHSHVGLTVLRGVGEDRGSASLFPAAMAVWDVMDEAEIHAMSLLGFFELLRFGSTTVVENSRKASAVAAAADRIGVRAVLSEMVADVDQYGIETRGYHYEAHRGEERLRAGLDLAARWHGAANGRLTVQLSPHAPDFCSKTLLTTIGGEARRRGLGLTLHLAQTPREVDLVKRLHGRGSVELLHEIGLLGPDVIAAHCIYVSDDEIRLLASTRTGVAHNASINAKRGRIPPAIQIMDLGGTVGLGTDNYHGNITEAWKFAISAARVRTGDATRLTPMQVLEMATVNGARALGRLDDLGSLEPGKYADLVIVDLQKPHFYPLIDPVGSFVHNAVGNDVETVIVDGRVTVDRGALLTLPPEEILASSQRAAEQVWSRLRAMYPGT